MMGMLLYVPHKEKKCSLVWHALAWVVEDVTTMNSHKNVIAGWPEVVLDHTSFIPAIHHQSPRIPFAILWFQLRPTLIFLKLEHLLTP
jgi:hypothetical protein